MKLNKPTYDLFLLTCKCGQEMYINVMHGYPIGPSDEECICDKCGKTAKAVKCTKPRWVTLGGKLVTDEEVTGHF
jgi:hypothetical protein